MNPELVFLIIVVVGLTVLFYFRHRSTEGFGINLNETREAIAQNGLNFVKRSNLTMEANQQLFEDELPKGILVNPGLNIGDLNDAVKQTDIYLEKSPDRDYTSYFVGDVSKFAYDRDVNLCKAAIHPMNLPEFDIRKPVNCGWWFVPGRGTVSKGALGTSTGPLFTDGLHPTGEWVWDRKVAVRKEDIKHCRNVNSCLAIGTPGIAGKCGWCDRRGYAVPIDGTGAEKYPGDTEGSCGERTSNSEGACPKPGVKPLITPSGTNCGTYGRASDDGQIRLYTKSECDLLGGKHVPNGECLMPQGGSFSAECARLNVRESRPVKTVCTPEGGRISGDCLLTMAVGYTPEGAIVQMVKGRAPGPLDNLALQLVTAAGVGIPQAVLGRGDIDKDSAAAIYRRIREIAATAKSKLTREAANYLSVGSDDFDPCDLDDSARGPFPLECLDRRWRMAGCQSSGAGAPAKGNNAARYNNMTFGQVSEAMRKIFRDMKSSDADIQDDAVKQCIGTTVMRPIPPPCFTCKNKILPETFVVAPNRQIATMKLTTNYKLSFTITPTGIRNDWAGIMHFTTGANCCGSVDRVPGFWFWPNSTSLHVRISDSKEPNWGLDWSADAFRLPMNEPTRVELLCRDESVLLTVGGKFFQFKQPNIRKSGDIRIYSGSPWYQPASANMEGVCFETFPETNKASYWVETNTDNPGFDINCYGGGTPASRCKAECDDNKNCKGFVEVPRGWRGDGGCCTKHSATGTRGYYKDLTFYTKKGYSNEDQELFRSGLDDKWRCISDIGVPLRKNAAGDVECMSENNRDCMWGDMARCKQLLNWNPPPGQIKPLACGAMHTQKWGGSGYDNAAHWCRRGRDWVSDDLPVANKKCFYGPWIGGGDGKEFQETAQKKLNDGRVLHMLEDDNFTKMVANPNPNNHLGDARYYRGRISQFDPARWNSYDRAFDNYRIKNCK
jgi:hypothetical protein